MGLVILAPMGARVSSKYIRDAGFVAYAFKPVRFRELKTILSRALAEQSGACGYARAVNTHPVDHARPIPFAGRKARILLAEDNIVNQQVALGVLRKLGLTVDAVANGVEAVHALKTIPYDLVLMDVQMPELDGIEAALRIRDPHTGVRDPRIPIVAMTAHATGEDRARCLAAGMNDYLTKPVIARVLAETLDKWLPNECVPEKGLTPVTSAEAAAVLQRKTGAQVFDKENMLDRLMNDEELAGKVIGGFLEDMPRQIIALKTYLVNGNVLDAGRQAHTIKGACANVGGEVLRDVAFEMEKAARSGDLDAVKSRMADLEIEFNRLKLAMVLRRKHMGDAYENADR